MSAINTLVWVRNQRAGNTSDEWIRELLGNLFDKELTTSSPGTAIPYALYMMASSQIRPSHLTASFLASARRTPGVGLWCHADEWMSGDYEAYRSFAYVIRAHTHPRFHYPGIKVVPLGYANGLPRNEVPTVASSRAHVWFFAGSPVGSRPEMLKALGSIEPYQAVVARENHVEEMKRLSKAEYHRAMADCVFAPCPMGNVILESYRFYEALENGAIPLIERRLFRDYYFDLFGRHPIPTFNSWYEASAFVRDIYKSSNSIDALQEEVLNWWRYTASNAIAEIERIIVDGQKDIFRKDLCRFPVNSFYIGRKAEQFVELARHHSVPAAMRRLRLSTRRLLRTGSIISEQRREVLSKGQQQIGSTEPIPGDERK